MASTTYGGLSAPRFTEEDEAAEWDAMSNGEHQRINNDVMGGSTKPRPAESASQLVDEMLAEVEKLSSSDTAALREARSRCPDEFNERKLDLFLVREDYDVKKASQRLAKYWTKRKALFGPDKFCLPMTQEGALRDDKATLALGLYRLLPEPDNSNRLIFFYDPTLLAVKTHKRDSYMRTVWYLMEVALENKFVRNGMVVVVNARSMLFEHFDRKFEKLTFELERFAWPVKYRAMHFIKPRSQIFKVMKPIIFFLLGRRLRSRLQLHEGGPMEVLESLSGYGLSYEVLPMEIDGDVELNHTQWLQDRRELEQSRSTSVAANTSP